MSITSLISPPVRIITSTYGILIIQYVCLRVLLDYRHFLMRISRLSMVISLRECLLGIKCETECGLLRWNSLIQVYPLTCSVLYQNMLREYNCYRQDITWISSHQQYHSCLFTQTLLRMVWSYKGTLVARLRLQAAHH